MTHTQRWHGHHGTAGTGHLDQGRYKSFPVQSDEHLLTLCRYVEQNALRANLVKRAEERRRGASRLVGPRTGRSDRLLHLGRSNVRTIGRRG